MHWAIRATLEAHNKLTVKQIRTTTTKKNTCNKTVQITIKQGTSSINELVMALGKWDSRPKRVVQGTYMGNQSTLGP